MAQNHKSDEIVVSLRDASLNLGTRKLWQGLNLDVKAGEFLAVLGPNGSGKTTLLQVLLGLTSLSSGSVKVCGEVPTRGSENIGYIPQQKSFDPDLPIRGRDLVHFGLDGHHYGVCFDSAAIEARVDQAISEVGATAYANAPIGVLSGGEQQRLRIAQALLSDPKVLLCDEPLLSLDLLHQQDVTNLINKRRVNAQSAVIFVTHDINPVLPFADHVLYVVGTRWAVGTPDEILTTKTLSDLYGTPVDVLRVRGRVVVVGSGDVGLSEDGAHHHEHAHKMPVKQS